MEARVTANTPEALRLWLHADADEAGFEVLWRCNPAAREAS
jgi:hypothetical protein